MRRQLSEGSPNIEPVSLAAGWTHFVIGSSLSPRAKKQLLSAARSLKSEQLTPLSAEQLFLPLIDLGVCHVGSAALLKRIIRSVGERHAAFKLFGEELVGQGLSEPIGATSQLITLRLRDRHDQLLLMRDELKRALSQRGFELGHQEKEQDTRRSGRSFVELPVGVSAELKGRPDMSFRGTVWVNDLILLSRPHDYLPQRGYQTEQVTKLLTEPPPSPSTQDLSVEERQALQERRAHELHLKLDQRLEERAQAYKDHTVKRASAQSPPEPKRRRRRRKRPENS